MNGNSSNKSFVGDAGWLALVALSWLVLMTVISVMTVHQYGFHRDELNFVENAKHLDWGYVEYPPLTLLIGRLVLDIFGASLAALRFTGALAVAIALWLTGLMTRDLGGKRPAQLIAMFATATAPIVLFDTKFFSYQDFDFLWWVLTTFCILRLIQTENPRWWLAIGATLGLGMMTKYSIPFLAAGIAGGVLLTPARRYLKSPWLWAGAGLALIIFLPNIIWEMQHGWVSLAFQADTRERNIQLGRTQSFLLEQFYLSTNTAAAPLWITGLGYLFIKPDGKRFRILGWIYLISLVLFLIAQGRSYYTAGLYPVLIAFGASQLVRHSSPAEFLKVTFWKSLSFGARAFYASLAVMGVFFTLVMLPLTPVNSAWWRFDAAINPELREEIGWPELVKEVASIYAALPVDEQARAGILVGNYGEAGAIALYGPAYGLPDVISNNNTYWLRGYKEPPPQTLIVLSFSRDFADSLFETCTLAGHNPNPYAILNEETRDHPDILLCRNLRIPWPEYWKSHRWFG